MDNISISTNRILLLICLIAVVVFIFTIVWDDLNFSFFIQLLFDDAQEFAQKRIISSRFMPVGYSGFLGTCIKIVGVRAIPACQAFVYAGILFAIFLFLKLRGLKDIWLALGTLVAAFHPMLILNIWRIHDGNLTILLLFGFLAAGIFYLRFKNRWSVLLIGVFAGLLFTVRQNTILILLAPLFLFFEGKRETKINHLIRIIIFVAGAVVITIAVNFTLTRNFLFLGNQGPYNFFSGTNEYAAKYLLKDFSGERSLEEALRARGFFASTTEARLSFSPGRYNQFAVEYIKNYPFEYMKLTGLKFFTFLRPGYHLPEGFRWFSTEGLKRVLKIILAAPFFVWVYILYRTKQSFFARENLFLFLAAIFYILPFLIANADPRYRFPLDIVFITDAWCRAKLIVKKIN